MYGNDDECFNTVSTPLCVLVLALFQHHLLSYCCKHLFLPGVPTVLHRRHDSAVPDPAWLPADDACARGALSFDMLRIWPAIIAAAADVRDAWEQAALGEKRRRSKL